MPTIVSSLMRASCARRLRRRFEKRLGGGILLLVFDLLRSLPEEEIGADRRAEDGDEHGEIAPRPFDVRNDKIEGDRSPGHADGEHRRDISEEGEREPAQHGDIARVAHKDFHEARSRRERRDIEPLRAWQNQSERGAHRAEVCAEVDDIGDDEQAHQRIEETTANNRAACWRRGPCPSPARSRR